MFRIVDLDGKASSNGIGLCSYPEFHTVLGGSCLIVKLQPKVGRDLR
jgi:hypothetical protein